MIGRRGLAGAAIAAVLALLPVVTAAPAMAAPGPAQAPEWWFDAWNVPGLWAQGADGTGITIAVIDTGVQADIPELAGKVLPGLDLIGNGTDGRTDFDSDAFSHGTAMASIMVASDGYGNIEGLAPGAKILPIAVPLRGVISNGTPTPSATATAVRYAADHGAKVISMSLGGLVFQSEDTEPCPLALQDAITYALSKGALVVAASGNSGDSGSPVEEPGVCLGTVSVGAVNQQSTVTEFSSRHPYLTVTAPGDNIPSLSKVPEQAYIGSGTSQATAITSAALAMVWSRYPTETNRQVLSRLLSTVTDEGPAGRDDQYGLGLIDPQRAISSASAASAPNPVFAGVQPLLALAAAKAGVPPTKPAAGVAGASIGLPEVGSPPSPLSGSVLASAGSTAILVLLGVGSLLRGVRRRSSSRFVR